MTKKPVVFVMLSGGVDSSVAAASLLDQGYEVVGVFMKCWSIEQLDSMGVDRSLYGCFWEEDAADARAVAGVLGIPFYVWDFQEEYKQKVVDYMIAQYRLGRTPNPDVMCNSVIKFGIFYDRAMRLGAEFVATGHYARRVHNQSGVWLARGLDVNKDQSYFLWRVPKIQLERSLFPVGEFASKSEVRGFAQSKGLVTAKKPDSQGLCFIGQTPLRQLLLQTLGSRPGDIVDLQGRVLGQHPGAFLYTIGQREKLGLPQGPWYVSKIDVSQNLVVVAHQKQDEALLSQELVAKELNCLSPLGWSDAGFAAQAQIRYRQQAQDCLVEIREDSAHVTFAQPVRAVAVGQSIVWYDQDKVLGGGVIDSKSQSKSKSD